MSRPSSPLTPQAVPHPFRTYNSCYIPSSSEPCMLHVISFHTVLCPYLTYMPYVPVSEPWILHGLSILRSVILAKQNLPFSNHVVVYIVCYSHRCYCHHYVIVTTVLLSNCVIATIVLLSNCVTVTTQLLQPLCSCHHRLFDSSSSYETKCKIIVS